MFHSLVLLIFHLGIKRIWSLQKHGARRPSWPAALDLSLNVLRQQFQFPHHTMEQLRVASAGLTIFSPPTSGIIEGVQIRPIEIRVNREELLKFERSGSRNTTGNAATFPVPEEDTVNDPIGTNSGYKLTGEWVLPDTKPEFPKHIFSGGAGSNPNLSRRSSTTATRTSEAATSPLFTPGTSANTNMSSDAKIVAEDKSLFSWAMDNLWWSKGTNNCTDGKRRSFETKQQPISSMVEQLQRDHIARKNASGSNIDLEAASSPPKTSAPRRKIIYYLHGGAYVFGNSRIYRPLTSYIAKATGMDIFVVNYRLAPESPFPASIHDAFAGYLHLIDPTHPAVCNQNPVTHVKLSGGNSEEGLSSTSSSPEENSRKLPTCIHPDDIIFMGDSAGGGLCVALMSYLKNYLRSDLGDPMIPLPSAAIILSPWLDIGCKSASWEINKDYDWLPSQARNIHENVLSNIPSPATMYVFGQDSKREINIAALLPERFLVEQRQLVKSNSSVLKLSEAEVRQRAVLDWMTMHPLVSPLYSDLTAMPPILLQIGSCELLVDESFTFAAKYYKENQQQDPQTTSIIRHEEYKDMVHVFQAMSWLPISALAMKHINHFISEMEAIYDDNDCFADDDNEDHQHHHRVDFYWKADKEDGEKVKINSFFKRKRHGNY